MICGIYYLAYIGATVLNFGPACMADDMTVQPKYKQKFKKRGGNVG